MKILLSAFAFAPNVGSEPGVGWRWALELAKDHRVIVVTDITRKELVDAVADGIPENLEVIYYRPAFLRRLGLNSVTAQIMYIIWQFGLYGLARKIHGQMNFDLAIHITYGVFRHPSFLGYLGIPFIFGPLGGGEDAPLALKRSIRGREKLKELLRYLVNKFALIDPFLWAAYAKSTLILTKTEDTRLALPWPFRKMAVIFPEIGVDAHKDIHPIARAPNEPLRVLFAGRLLGWKGAHLAIRAVSEAIRRGVPVDFTLLGKGPFEEELRRIARLEGIHDRIRWLNHLPQQELFSIYQQMHCFIFPSLHDSSGNVVLEAQSFGLPIICLDLGGPAALVSPESAIIIRTEKKTEDRVILDLSMALERMWVSEPERIRASFAAIEHAKNMSWESRVRTALAMCFHADGRDK